MDVNVTKDHLNDRIFNEDEQLQKILKLEENSGIMPMDPFEFKMPKSEPNIEPSSTNTMICTEKEFNLDRWMTFETDVKSEEIAVQKGNYQSSASTGTQNDDNSVELVDPRQHLNQHQSIHTDKPYLCDHCSKSFSRKTVLKIHLLTYFGEKKYSCNECSSRFVYLFQLNAHMKTHIAGEKLECTKCSKTFSRKSYLRKHIRVHADDREKYACEYENCLKLYSSRSALAIHKRKHSGVKPFTCFYCAKKFPTKAQLNEHRRIHTNERPFSCEICSKSFRQSGAYFSHKRIHTNEKPFSCPNHDCPKTFRTKSKLQVHSRSHTGFKPYPCGKCSKAFTSKNALKNHEREHDEGRALLLVFK